MSVHFVAFDGELGVGKTTGMTLFAKYMQNKTGCTLYSNYNLKGTKEISNYKTFFDVAEQESSIILLDEVHQDLDNRNFKGSEQKFFTQLLNYLRKIRTTIFMTTPVISELDVRLRRRLQLYCRVSKSEKYFKYDFYRCSDGEIVDYIKTLKIERKKAYALLDGLFDTYRIVKPLVFPETKNDYVEFLEKLERANMEYLQRRASGHA